jgi:hypothetical protein
LYDREEDGSELRVLSAELMSRRIQR